MIIIQNIVLKLRKCTFAYLCMFYLQVLTTQLTNIHKALFINKGKNRPDAI